jgi:hypothetical protein
MLGKFGLDNIFPSAPRRSVLFLAITTAFISRLACAAPLLSLAKSRGGDHFQGLSQIAFELPEAFPARSLIGYRLPGLFEQDLEATSFIYNNRVGSTQINAHCFSRVYGP